MKLFTLTLPSSDELVGIEINGDEYFKSAEFDNYSFEKYAYNGRWWRKSNDYEDHQHPDCKAIGTLSDVTEEMAREWGFEGNDDEHGYWMAIEELKEAISDQVKDKFESSKYTTLEGFEKYQDDLSNIF